MKLLPLPEPTSGEFEGRTLEEALQLAYQELGTEALLRCWKVRRGGIFGFFARESFVAGLTPPASATVRPKGGGSSRSRRGGQEHATPQAPSHLYDLVEATRDEVTLGADLALESDFSKVLAQAEEALVSAAADRITPPLPSSEPVQDDRERIEGLRANLAGLGVPADYLPEESETLDALARSLAKLPSPAPMVKVAGSLLVVVGSQREALAAAQHVVANLGLDASDLIVGDPTSSGRQRVMRRRSGKKMTVLVVQASLSSRGIDQIATWIDRLKPDYVLGAVPATVKPSDFSRWQSKLGRIDALALSRVTDTTSMAELMGTIPIALLDGAPASTLRWVALLLNSMLEREH